MKYLLALLLSVCSLFGATGRNTPYSAVPTSIKAGAGIQVTTNFNLYTISTDGSGVVTNVYTTNMYVTNLYSSTIYNSNFFSTNIYSSNFFNNFSWITNAYIDYAWITNLYAYSAWITNLYINIGYITNAYTSNLYAYNVTITNQLHFATNSWSGPTNDIDISGPYDLNYTTTTPVAITGFTNKPSDTTSEILLSIYNASGSNIDMTFPAGLVDGNWASSQTITNGTVGCFWLRYTPVWPRTNCVFRQM